MTRALFAALALLASADPGAEAKNAYALESTGSTSQVRVGEQGKLVVVIRPLAPGWHIHPQAPLKIRFRSAGLAIAKAELSRADAVNPGAEAPRFETSFVASEGGEKEATASLDFFICSDTACVKQARTLSIPIAVR
ncbi:MAG TPA: hypothetical protein VLV17_08485 [Anaeromyxobacteraceae bacterium]|nr:hypothetical protein [Anaeromyxobacteraceae bacterium]